MQTLRFLLSLTIVVLLGCDAAPVARSPSGVAPQAPVAPVAPTAPNTNDDASQNNTTDETDNAAQSNRQVAEVGVGKKGRNYGGGIVSEPIRAMFRTEQRLQFIQLQKAMQLYKASHNNQLPETHEAFMKEIVEFNQIQLPELPEGERYVFDPEAGELMVERPQ